MNTDIEPVMSAMFDHLVASAKVSFTADAGAGDTVLSNVSTVAGLFAGLPVFGPGLAAGAMIQEADAAAATVTLSSVPSAEFVAADFVTGFLTTGRRVVHWTQCANQPAFFFRRVGMLDEYAHESFFGMTTLECEAWIYCNAGKNPAIAPDTVLTPLERMVRDSFAPDGDYGDPRFTVGGLAYWARIEGRSDISPGDQGPQAIARIPIRITLP